MRFTREQREFINIREPRLLLDAPAGSGKTEVVAERVRVLAEEGKTVRLVCFTHSARHTLQKRLDASGVDVEVRTVVSLAHEVLTRSVGAGMFEVGDGMDIAREVCVRGVASAAQLTNFESLTANGAPLPDTMNSAVGEVFNAYQELKAERGYLTYIDVVLLANGLQKFGCDELIVDEAQDLTPSQLSFILGFDAQSITLVGDPDQAIYGFSGVNSLMFKALEDEGWHRSSLTKSFRVPAGIIPAVNAARSQPLTAVRDGGSMRVIKTEYKRVAELLENELEHGDAVVGRNVKSLDRVASRLEQLTDKAVSKSWELGELPETVYFATVHSAKGGEWQRVFVLDVGQNGMWSPMSTELAEAKRLFYVAASRALTELVLVQIGDELPWGL